MNKKEEYKKISKRARSLLEKGENIDVDYKRNINGISMDDFVAFANSENGGAILIGVREINDRSGIQRGKVVGCPVDDNQKLRLVNKAKECVPIIEFDLIIENSSSLPFYRLEIPSGKNKPYCTPKGTYLIRANGRNIPMLPNNLLNLFLKLESESFIKKFKSATKELISELNVLKKQAENLKEVQQEIYDKSWQLEGQMEEIFNAADSAQDLSDDAMTSAYDASEKLDYVESRLEEMDISLNYIVDCNRALFKKLRIEDPEETNMRIVIKSTIEQFCKKSKDLDTLEKLVFKNYSSYKKKLGEFKLFCVNF